MTKLVTLEQAKAQLEMDHNLSDDMIEFKIHQASAAVLTYIKAAVTGRLDTSGEWIGDVPYDVQAAVLLLLGDMFKNREPAADAPVPAEWGYGYLPQPVVALLYAFRVPTVQ